MSYVAKQLAKDESVIFATTLHPVIFAGPTLLGVLGLPFFLVQDGAGAAVLTLGIAAIWFFGVWLRYVSSEFAVTTRRVIIKVGLISRRTMETLLTKIEGVQVDQGILGRVFNYGTIRVTGTGGTREPFKHIKQPLDFRQRVQDGASGSHARAAEEHLRALHGGGDHAVSDTVDRLERLAKLRDQGVLSSEEFEEQKRKLLS